ncbi:MAG: hypothetical protein IID32_06360, partial [Planctomycetes bacterium]|nr:hypothetical protein [Planctomycetota bacterium]
MRQDMATVERNTTKLQELDEWRKALEARGAKIINTPKGFKAQCPMPDHPDEHPSLHVEQKNGKLLVYCHGCNAPFEKITEALFGNSNMQRQEPMKTYDYRDENNTLLYQVCRGPGKRFFQQRPDNNGGWITDLNGVRRVLYNLLELKRSDPSFYVFVVEGEKDADRLTSLGKTATTNSGGAGKWKPQYNETLRGRDVVLIPDNDKQGREHMANVARQLHGTAASIKIIILRDLRDKGDVSDWLNEGHDGDELSRLVDEAAPYTPTVPVTANEDTTFSLSEQGNGERFAAMHNGKVKYCPERKQWL